MRTTLTLDEDVAVQLECIRREQHARLREVANEALRLGLRQMSKPPRSRTVTRTRAVSLGRCLIGSIDDVSETLAVAEGETFR